MASKRIQRCTARCGVRARARSWIVSFIMAKSETPPSGISNATSVPGKPTPSGSRKRGPARSLTSSARSVSMSAAPRVAMSMRPRASLASSAMKKRPRPALSSVPVPPAGKVPEMCGHSDRSTATRGSRIGCILESVARMPTPASATATWKTGRCL